MPHGKNNQVQVTREEIPIAYADLLQKNPLLGRIEGAARNIGWNDLEIRTMQLLTAVSSNASLQQRLQDLEARLRTTHGHRV